MAVNNKANDRVNQGIILLLGIIILLGAILTYLFILKGIFGNFSSAEILPDIKSFKTVFSESQPKAAILYSRYTENMLPKSSTWVKDNLNTWKKFLSNSKIKYDVISDASIETGKHYDYQLIILPGSKSLSDKEIIELKKYLDKGGSIYATGGIASYSVDGKWRGWEFFSEIFGLKFSREIKTDENSLIHTLRGNLPLTANIPAGYPLKIAAWDRPMSAEVLDPRTTQVSFWYNYRLDEGLVREEIKKSSGIAYGNYGKGRFVWMGFEVNSVIGVQEDFIFFEKLFKNSLNWLLYEPVAYIKDWPSGFSAAAVIAPLLNEDINNVKNLFDILKRENINATFFIDAEKANQNKNLVKSLTNYGEIAAIVDIGYLTSKSDTINKLNDYQIQLQKLKNAKSTIEQIINQQMYGFIPYYGFSDNNTIKALIDTNYNYLVTDSLTDRSVPKTIIRGEDRIIEITKTARDDYEVVRDNGLTQSEFQFYTYQEDIDRILFEGGLYFFKVHSEYQCKAEYAGVVREVIQELKRKNYWITTANEIQNWYAKRDFLEIRTERRGKRRVAVTVSNPGAASVSNLTVIVDLNDTANNIELSTENIGTKKAEFSHKKGDKNLYLFINDLEADESRTYFIDYDKPNI